MIVFHLTLHNFQPIKSLNSWSVIQRTYCMFNDLRIQSFPVWESPYMVAALFPLSNHKRALLISSIKYDFVFLQ